MVTHTVFGLGNPGVKYRYTRHNAGFMVLDVFAKKHKIPFTAGKGDYYFCRLQIGDNDILFVKPLLYMNLSGVVVGELFEKYRVDLQNILIIYDDFHLPLGEIRFRSKGSAAGHNGLQSILDRLGSTEIPRLKIGIGSEFDNSVDFVLSPFDTKEKDRVVSVLDFAAAGLESWITEGMQKTMNYYNKNIFKDNE